MSEADEVILKGDLYTDRIGQRVPADCDGLLVRFGPEVRLIPDVRLAGALNQIGGWRVKKRHQSEGGP